MFALLLACVAVCLVTNYWKTSMALATLFCLGCCNIDENVGMAGAIASLHQYDAMRWFRCLYMCCILYLY